MIRDRVRQFTGVFDAVLARRGDRDGENPATQPKGECLCRETGRTVRADVPAGCLLPGQRYLRAVLDDCAARYNQHRPHRALNSRRRALPRASRRPSLI